MQTLHFVITINAPAKQVWEIMLGSETYLQWASAFTEGSHFEGDWSTGSKMLFLGPGPEKSGMVAVIAENRPYEFLSIKHIGYIENGVEDTESDQIKAWAPAFENYTFKETGGQTELKIDLDSEDKYVEMFNEMWPKALEKLKELAEK